MMLRRTGLLLLLYLMLAAGWAQGRLRLEASLSTPRCGMEEQVVLELRLTGASQDPQEPDLPNIDGLEFRSIGVSKSLSMINGISSSASTYTYLILPRREGRYRIPPISLEVDGQTLKSPALHLEVVTSRIHPAPSPPPANPPPRNPSLYPPPLPGANPWGGPLTLDTPLRPPVQPVRVECEVSQRRPYVNQLVVYTFRFLHSVNLQGQPSYEPPAATGFLREDLGQSTSTVERDGVTYSVSEVKTAFFPTSAGHFVIGPTRLTCQVRIDPFDPMALFNDPVRELSSEPVELEVLPLPSEGRPPSFQGAVGSNFEFEARLPSGATEVKTGSAFKLLLSLKGDEHPDLLLEPNLPNWPGLRTYSPETQVAAFDRSSLRAGKTFKYSIVAQQPGSYSLGPLSFSYFDPEQRRYRTLQARAPEIKVRGARASEPGATATPLPGSSEQPLAPPQPGNDSDPSWARQPGLVGLALLPWALSLAVLGVARIHRGYEESRSTPRARILRLRRQIQASKSLEEVHELAYQGLQLIHQQSLRGLPHQKLKELLPEQLVERLAEVEALRFAPQPLQPEGQLRQLKDCLLQELKVPPR